MDLYLLDANFSAVALVDTFESLVWTERYNANGDITLIMPATAANKALFVEGMFFQLTGSTETVLIESVQTQGGQLTITGPTLTGFLTNRMFRDTWSTLKDSWNRSGYSTALALQIVMDMCAQGGAVMASSSNFILPSNLGIAEIISNLYVAPDPGGGVFLNNIAIPYGTLYDAVKMVCDMDNLGFTIRPFPGVPTLFQFMVYRGKDLTSTQTTNSPVIFESALDTLIDVTELRSISGYKTHAYVWANGMAQSSMGIAVAPGASTATNWQRRTLMVDASDVNASDYTAAALKQVLDQKAADALANNNYVRMVDGQIVPQTAYVYGIDYSLGDVIELRGSSTTAQKARITEYIRAQDNTGYRAYPTLSVIG